MTGLSCLTAESESWMNGNRVGRQRVMKTRHVVALALALVVGLWACNLTISTGSNVPPGQLQPSGPIVGAYVGDAPPQSGIIGAQVGGARPQLPTTTTTPAP